AGVGRLGVAAAEIAELLSMALSTVSAVLQRVGLGKLSRLDPPEPPNRYEHAPPGGLLHLDIQKLGRILSPGRRAVGHRRSQKKVGPKSLGAAGWEFVHVCVDDATRLAYAEVVADERGRLLAPRGGLVSEHRHRTRTGAERQRRLLPLESPCQR